jgi:CBS domain-containing protein
MKVTYAVRNAMTRDIVSVEATASVKEALHHMTERDIGSVIVTRSGKMVGILTERDVLKKCCPEGRCDVMKAGDLMSSPLVTIEGDAAIGEAADLMATKKIRERRHEGDPRCLQDALRGFRLMLEGCAHRYRFLLPGLK